MMRSNAVEYACSKSTVQSTPGQSQPPVMSSCLDPAHISRADEAAAACALVVGVIGVAAAVLGKTNVLGGFATAFAAARAVGGDGGKELVGGSGIHD